MNLRTCLAAILRRAADRLDLISGPQQKQTKNENGLLNKVKAQFILQGSSLTKWCRQNKISAGAACTALMGIHDGPASRELVKKIIEAAENINHEVHQPSLIEKVRAGCEPGINWPSSWPESKSASHKNYHGCWSRSAQ